MLRRSSPASWSLLAIYINATDWFVTPSDGSVVNLLLITVSSVGWAFAITMLSTGLRNRRALARP